MIGGAVRCQEACRGRWVGGRGGLRGSGGVILDCGGMEATVNWDAGGLWGVYNELLSIC